MSEQAGTGYSRSTFSRLEKYGLVLVCEVSQQKDLLPRDLVSAQLALGLTALQFLLEMKDSQNIEQTAATDG